MSIESAIESPITNAITSSILPEAGDDVFALTDIADLQLWLDSSDESTITAGVTFTWADKSGNGYDYTQSNGSLQPTTGARTLNGLNVIDFDGSEYLERSDVAGMNGRPALTIFTVYDYDTSGFIDALWNLGSANGGLIAEPDGFRFGNGFALAGNLTTGASYITTWQLPSNAVQGDTVVYVDGVAQSLIINNPSNNVDINNIHSFVGFRNLAGTNFFDGGIAELAFYKRELSVAEMNQVGNYLADKWGVTWTEIT